MNQPDTNPPDLRERGRAKDGAPVYSSRRLWVQFLAFGDCTSTVTVRQDLVESGLNAALYADLNDPRGIGLIWMHEDPAFFTGAGRDFLNSSAFARLTLKPEFTMTARSYAVGYESDLDDVLVNRPRNRILDPANAWAIWYPVRRSKAFESLPEDERHRVLMDHGEIGKSFGKAKLAQDIRLACHGVDKLDNDFVIGVLAPELAACSLVVQAMRHSLQTMHHLDGLGPFFTGKVMYQSGPGGANPTR